MSIDLGLLTVIPGDPPEHRRGVHRRDCVAAALACRGHTAGHYSFEFRLTQDTVFI
ncbi:MAG TPA: hypothetical protein VFU36_10630 [Jatrophihabitans sp.]|nr:hypothetical protein [Jatrophihabitans sp.]